MGRGGASANDMLLPVEAAQVQAILRNALEKLSLASVITVDADEQAAELSRSVGDEISRVIHEQRQLEQRFEVLISQRGILKAMPNKTKYKENQKELHEVANQLRQSTKLLCRNLKENPNVAGNMLKIQTERMQLQTLLSTCVVELEDCSYETLVNKVEEEEAREKLIAQTIERERAATQAVKLLKVQLKEEKTAHDEEMADKKKILTVLKDELKELKYKTSTEQKYKEKEFNADSQCTRRCQSTIIHNLEAEIDRLRAIIDIEKQVHTATLEFLADRQDKLQEMDTNWKEKLSTDTQSKDGELESLKRAQQRDKDRLDTLVESTQKEQAEKELRANEERRAMQEENRHLNDRESQLAAAIKIQACWRGWKVRSDQNPSLKRSGKKGKKKK
uniref:Dynein regulatory complex protein 9 n=1 Tax=Pyramimonas obovata TaxID=1411642 RepID=A0A7S0MXQ0_9CHLO|mmetsp:Transcript_14450/g.30907  ORF Transcript_14450/g.30907 Transcript_14450/m.30907 type:complete len:391 (+) Transcript_14450:212-1384(+)|eukprot:CAMPEP_0118923788 /NCGR_PEP_ID=MMETSP1169-20130426/2192_1 /TAXON_ID=36882 /ORGANISM="Pyramimonas obovata, Strain CCMP722" /LENGTH=390 /DNA_ID=CAMNT_0006864835 /DNA_START=199 /DNA_END=1371 /DNA_ORIENTATION=+